MGISNDIVIYCITKCSYIAVCRILLPTTLVRNLQFPIARTLASCSDLVDKILEALSRVTELEVVTRTLLNTLWKPSHFGVDFHSKITS